MCKTSRLLNSGDRVCTAALEYSRQRTCWRYSFTYASAFLKMTLRFSLAFLRASVLSAARWVAHCSSRWRFFRSDSGTSFAILTPGQPRKGKVRREQCISFRDGQRASYSVPYTLYVPPGPWGGGRCRAILTTSTTCSCMPCDAVSEH